MEHEDFQARFLRLFSRAPAGLVRDHRFLALAPARADWADTGLELHPGDRATVLALAGLHAAAIAGHRFQAMMRVGPAGPVFCGGGPTHSILASKPGTLHFSASPIEDGGVAPASLSLVAVRWRTPALEGLRSLANGGDVGGLVREEIGRLCDPRDASALRSARPARRTPRSARGL
jgi:hypothetical protein